MSSTTARTFCHSVLGCATFDVSSPGGHCQADSALPGPALSVSACVLLLLLLLLLLLSWIPPTAEHIARHRLNMAFTSAAPTPLNDRQCIHNAFQRPAEPSGRLQSRPTPSEWELTRSCPVMWVSFEYCLLRRWTAGIRDWTDDVVWVVRSKSPGTQPLMQHLRKEIRTWRFYSPIGYAEWYPLASPPEVWQSFKEVLSTSRSVGDAHWARAVASALGVCLVLRACYVSLQS